MNISKFRSVGLRIITITMAALFSTMALAISLKWQFEGWANDQANTSFAALMSFDTSQQGQVITSTITTDPNGGTNVITATVQTENFTFDALSFALGTEMQGSTAVGSIVQTDVLGTGVFTDTYSIKAIFGSQTNTITPTLVIDFMGYDLFNSLLTDVNVLQNNVPGTFLLTAGAFSVTGTIQSVSELTAIPEPWTLGLMFSGLGSLTFLSLFAIRSRRNR